MIAGIVHFYPATSWLWLAGAGVAIISLGAIVTSSYFLERQFKKTERTLNLAGGEGLAVSSSLKHNQLDCRSFDDGADGGDGANGSD